MNFSSVRLYCITTPPKAGQTYQEMVEAACKGGADAIQLREKNIQGNELVHLARELQTICKRYGVFFILNDDIDAAIAADVDGVHLGQEDGSATEARKRLGSDKILGISCHSLEQALKAEADGVSYVSCGPLFATPTKPGRAAVGLELIAEYRKCIALPFVAIGGIDETNIEEVIGAGAECIAVVRAVCGAEDVEIAARRLKEKVR